MRNRLLVPAVLALLAFNASAQQPSLDAMIDRDLGVLGGGDALERERDVVQVLEALHVIPGELAVVVLALNLFKSRSPA